jgi:hypothetical protein
VGQQINDIARRMTGCKDYVLYSDLFFFVDDDLHDFVTI